MPSVKQGTVTEHIEEAIQVESIVLSDSRGSNNPLCLMRQERAVLLWIQSA